MLSPLMGKHLLMYHSFSEGSPYADYDGVIADGSVRSGKTAAMAKMYLDYVLSHGMKYPNVSSLISGQTYTSAVENVIEPYIIPELDAMNLKYKEPSKSNDFIIYDGIHKIKMEVHGGQLSNSFTKIKGRTYLAILVDEGTEMHRSFIQMAETRLSLPDSKMFINTNPDKPDHYVKTDIVDSVDSGAKKFVHYHFTLDDNPYLEDSVKDKLKRSFSGIFYERYILGRWVVVEGRVYGNFDSENIKDFALNPLWEYYVGLDFGWNDECAIIFMAYDRAGDCYYIIDEFIESFATLETMGSLMTGGEARGAYGVKQIQHNDLLPYGVRAYYTGHEANQRRQEAGGFNSRRIIEDKYPSLKSKIVVGHHYIDLSIQSTYNYIGETGNRRLFVNPRCEKVIRDFNNYQYPQKDGSFYGEQPDTSNKNHKYSHSMDAIRYVVDSVTPVMTKRKITMGFGKGN